MKKGLLVVSSLSALLILTNATTVNNANAAGLEGLAASPKWNSVNEVTQSPKWFKKQLKTDNSVAKVDKTKKQYNLIHKNGKSISQEEISSLVEGIIDFLPDENNKQSNLIAVGYYNVDGHIQTDFYFSNIEDTPVSDIEKFAIENASEEYTRTNEFTTKLQASVTTADQPNTIMAAAATNTYIDTYHWAIYSDTEKYSDGTYVVAGLLDSSVEYTKQGEAISGGQTVSIWDMKASTSTRPVNGYQTRQIGSRHTVEPYVPDQKLISYGPTTTTAGSNFSVSLTGGLPTISWNFQRQTVDVIDNSSMGTGYGKWTFDFPLGTGVSESTYLMQPGIRITNATGMAKFQHSHSGYYYKNLSYAGNGVSGLVVRELPDR